MKSFLLIGQSNMAGRGDFGEVPEIENSKCFMLRMGRWQPMSEPINPDRRIWGYYHSGVGLAASFADNFANYFEEDIGLIPCADGGTELSLWMPGEILFDNAVMQTKLAMRSSEFAGILWHQGESDSKTREKAETYHDRLTEMLLALKKEIGAEVPVVVGGLGDFVKDYNDCLYADIITEATKAVAKEQGYGFVSAKGLPCKNDRIHFTSASYRELGKRYFEAYIKTLKMEIENVKA